jgi:hypothetical protein
MNIDGYVKYQTFATLWLEAIILPGAWLFCRLSNIQYLIPNTRYPISSIQDDTLR